MSMSRTMVDLASDGAELKGQRSSEKKAWTKIIHIKVVDNNTQDSPKSKETNRAADTFNTAEQFRRYLNFD